MNDPKTIASGIVDIYCERHPAHEQSARCGLAEEIVKALREYAEQKVNEAMTEAMRISDKAVAEADAEGYARGLLERHKPGDPLCDKCDEAGYRRGLKDLMDWIKSDAQCKDKKCPHHDLATCIETRIQRGTGGGE